MRLRRGKVWLGLMGICMVGAVSAAEAGSRDVKKMGIFGGAIGAPFPSIWGANAAYNVLPFLRGSVGVGFTELTDTLNVSATTINAEAKLMVPDWNFSPSASAGFSSVSATVTGSGELSALGGLTQSGSLFYVGGGIDWQTDYGLNIGVDLKIPFIDNGKMLPGVYLGFFF